MNLFAIGKVEITKVNNYHCNPMYFQAYNHAYPCFSAST